MRTEVPVAVFAIFGFGKHAPSATPAPDAGVPAHAIAVLQAVPIGIWIAVIGLITAIAGPVTAHVLEARRAKSVETNARGVKDA